MTELCGRRHQTKDHEAVCVLPQEDHPGGIGALNHLTKVPCCDQHRTGFGWTEIIDMQVWNAAHARAQNEWLNNVFDSHDELVEANRRLREHKCLDSDKVFKHDYDLIAKQHKAFVGSLAWLMKHPYMPEVLRKEIDRALSGVNLEEEYQS